MKNSSSQISLLEKKIAHQLVNFTQAAPENMTSGIFGNFHKFSINEAYYDELRLIRYLFVKFLNFTVWDQPFEKVNWEIPFKYKTWNASFAHQKFGFRLYIENKMSVEEAQNLFKEIIKIVLSCLKLSQPLIRTEGINCLQKGEIIVENKLSEIEKEFRFFLKESKRKIKKSNVTNSVNLSSPTKPMNFRLYEEGIFLSDAAYVSFFSLLEHLCILGLAFTNAPERYEINTFAGKNWQDKFKLVFPLKNPKFTYFYNKFVNLAKYRRNPTAHGHLDKLHTIFHFYLPEARHRIPMGLYDRELFFELKKEDNLDILVSFLKLIRQSGETKKWLSYLDRGFDIYYEPQVLLEYQAYIQLTHQQAKDYLNWQSRLEDDMSNMDW